MKFSGQGTVFVARRADDGTLGPWLDVGCADALSVGLSVDSWEHQEKCSGARAVDARGIKALKGSVALDLTDFSQVNIGLAVNGASVVGASGTVSAEVLPIGQVVGSSYMAAHQGLSTLVVHDSTGSPVTLALGTDYTVDLRTGVITFLTVTGTQPYKLAYSYVDDPAIGFFTASTPELALRFNYINTQGSNRKGVVSLYRVRFDPASLDWINDEYQTIKLSGSLLIDPTKSATGPLGQFGYVTFPPAPA